MNVLIAAFALALLQSPEEEAAKKCDSQIPWLTDGIPLIDMPQSERFGMLASIVPTAIVPNLTRPTAAQAA